VSVSWVLALASRLRRSNHWRGDSNGRAFLSRPICCTNGMCQDLTNRPATAARRVGLNRLSHSGQTWSLTFRNHGSSWRLTEFDIARTFRSLLELQYS
jgi:hypothetical protein